MNAFPWSASTGVTGDIRYQLLEDVSGGFDQWKPEFRRPDRSQMKWKYFVRRVQLFHTTRDVIWVFLIFFGSRVIVAAEKGVFGVGVGVAVVATARC